MLKIKNKVITTPTFTKNKSGKMIFNNFKSLFLNKQSNKKADTDLQSKWGFTLVELLVVISIIGLLSVITFDGVQKSKLKSKDATIKSNLITLRNVGAFFFANNQKYTNTLVDINCTTPNVPDSIFPQASAIAKGVFFATDPGWSALHNSIALSSDPTDSQCVVGSDGYIIAIRLATGGVLGDSEPDTICIDHQGSMTLRSLAIGERAKDSIDYANSRCAN